ncbi:OmpL47-type beta-barrel domain-containing protein [Dyadobacter sandarakinus]|uniref:Ig-like domain-containing protein n=1 Tax=Dyadobacter sandarakinus TaxID=2747268 RepID=A0ABX7I246_9BACT|nr:Ig-like domain-containing protein [Dyadobacter sandarakinus]QRQ99893.1 Ig-like domain-containing protein [Dyadobacter sandarakinus]
MRYKFILNKSYLFIFLLLVCSGKIRANNPGEEPATRKPENKGLFALPAVAGCGSISTFPCTALKQSLPLYLVFDNHVSGSLTDKNGVGTGFPMARNYSGRRLIADGSPSVAQVPGYEPSRITLSGGRIRMLANKGLDFKTENNLINALGVQVPTARKMQIEVKVVSPSQNMNSAQAGLWFGINDKTFLKLSVGYKKVELRRERNDVTATVTNTSNPDQRVTGTVEGMSNKSVRLRLVLDFVTNKAEGFYSLDGITYISTGSRYSDKSVNISDLGFTADNVFTGIYCTYRDALLPITYSFDDFSVEDTSQPDSQFQNVNVNFRPQGTAAPSGYIADYGLPFDNTRKYGWVNPSSMQPIDMKLNMRQRTGTDAPPQQLSVVQMQATVGGQVPGTWQYLVPNGFYQVTVSAGDYDYFNSCHQINVQGLPLISDFTSSTQTRFRVRTGFVQVNDGKLTVDALGGDNTKMNYVSIKKAVAVADAVAPTASARFVGKTQSSNVYLDQVQLYLTASDEGGAGLKSFQYALDGDVYTNYVAPFSISTQGNHTLKIKTVDGNNNQTISNTYNFTVTQPSQKIQFSSERLAFTILRGNPVPAQSVTVTPTSGYTLTKSEAPWLTLPGASGKLTFGPQQIATNLEPGRYQAHVMASANGYEAGNLVIDLLVIDPLTARTINVNFQDPATKPPLNYVRDFGQAFGPRMDTDQSVGLVYGWKRRTDGTPLDLSGNGRKRPYPQDLLLATLLHMQADDITTNFQGTKVEGYWEAKVPNGTYDVTVSVGDGVVNTAPEAHFIKVEDIVAIQNFVPSGKQGTISRFKSNTIRVVVKDELLTINADGGNNTKITHANIVPVSLSPYLYWSSKTSNLILDKTASDTKILSVSLGRSDNASGTYSISATYGAGASNWLTFGTTASGVLPSVSFNYTALRNLPLGIYKATVKATSGTLTSAEFNIQVNVVDGKKPYVISSNPANGASNVSLNMPLAAANNLSIPSAAGVSGVDNNTIDTTSVFLYKVVNGQQTVVWGTAQGSVGGDVISKNAKFGLEPSSTYRFVVTTKVKSLLGDSFAPYEATFTTSSAPVDSSNILNARFKKVTLPATQNKKYTSLAVGPDGKLYGLRMTGVIDRYVIDHTTGQLSSQQTINTLFNKYGDRLAIGLAFDPTATSANPIVWITHSKGVTTNGPEFDGNLSRLSGANLENEQLMVTRLPRSTKDHLVNSVAFGPDGALYICQGSMSSAGRYDSEWQRDESLLSATVLRLDISKLTTLPLNAQTTFNQALINAAPLNSVTFSDGTYNPYASNAPLTIFASGVRNAYDLLWHSNGQLYLPTNGSGGQGNTPASVPGTRKVDGTFYSGPEVPATTGVQAQTDWLFRINPSKPVGFFGHPNPLRGEYVINRGYQDDTLYLPSVKADANFRPGFDFGTNNSPNGVIEYKSNTFNGILKNKVLVVRFSGGGDIAVLEPGSKVKTGNPSDDSIYDIVKINTGSSNMGLTGMSGFGNPLDLVEDVVNGNLYVSEFNWNDDPTLIPQITLLQVTNATPPPVMSLAATTRTAQPDANARQYDVALGNDGGGVLEIKEIRLAGSGSLSMEDILLPSSGAPLRIPKDSTVNFRVLASANLGRLAKGKLIVTSTDNTVKEIEINGADGLELLRAAESDDNKGEDHHMTVYPNPSSGNPVNIRLEKFNRQEPVTIYLYDLKGNVIRTVSGVADGRGEFSMQLTDKSRKPGSYIVKVVYISGARFAKIVQAD